MKSKVFDFKEESRWKKLRLPKLNISKPRWKTYVGIGLIGLIGAYSFNVKRINDFILKKYTSLTNAASKGVAHKEEIPAKRPKHAPTAPVQKQQYHIHLNPNGTDAKIGIPKNAKFTPKFSFKENYTVELTPEIRKPSLEERTKYGLSNTTYIIIEPGNEDYAKKYNFDATAFRIKKDDNVIATGFSDIGKKIFIQANASLLEKISDGAEFEVLALREIGNTNHYNIVASYRNGILKAKIDLDDILTTYTSEDSFKGWYMAGLSFKKSSKAINKTPLVKKYLYARNPYGFINPIDKELFKSDFKNLIYEIADSYKNSINSGKTHSESLEQALKESSLYGVNTKNDVTEALLIAQRMGNNVIINRWNSKLFDDSEVATFIGEMYAKKYDTKMTNKDILERVAKRFGHTMSQTTMYKYLNMF